MATRQNSSSGKPKSPRVQVVLPEELCSRLTSLAEQESRTVSNMAKVLIQEGVNRHEASNIKSDFSKETEQFRNTLESQGEKRLQGVPKRLKFFKP